MSEKNPAAAYFHGKNTRPAVFLDRDGTINTEVHYLSRPDQLELLPTVAETISRLNTMGIAVVVVTNQAGIARGYFSELILADVHEHLRQLLSEQNAMLDAIYYCPHHPTEGLGGYRIDCHCRKPKPGMLSQAARELGIDLSRSLMIGDRESDLRAGANAGCCTALVLTGYGEETSKTIDLRAHGAIGIFRSIADAVDGWMNLSS